MGVMACNRNGCENVMCDYMICGHYICSDCLEELNEVRKSWPEYMPKIDVEDWILEFLNSRPGRQTVNTEEEFKRLLTSHVRSSYE